MTDDLTPYRKKKKKRAPAKSDHKHDFQPCIFDSLESKFTKDRGFVPNRVAEFGTYCPVCGKIGPTEYGRWTVRRNSPHGWLHNEYTDAAKLELDPATRTLPTFKKDDFFQKFVTHE